MSSPAATPRRSLADPRRPPVLALLCLALTACGGGSGGGASTGSNGGGSTPPTNPVPVITSVTDVTLGFNAIVPVKILGTDFVSNCEVFVDSAFTSPILASSSELDFDLPASVQIPGPHMVRVVSPGPGGGPSNSVTMVVNNTVPSLQSASPPQVTASDSGFSLTLNGADFNTSTEVMFNGVLYTPQVLTASQLEFSVPGYSAGAAGYLPVSVVNPGPGGGTSAVFQFPVQSLPPALNSQNLVPLARDWGDTPYALYGSGFNSSTTVQFNGMDVGPVSLGGVWGTSITFIIPASLLHSTGAFPLTVTNPAPGGGSATVNVSVVNPQPTLISMVPAGVAAAGQGPVNITLTGVSFEPESAVYFNNQPLPTIFTSATTLTAQVPGALLAQDGVFGVEVITPSPGGGVTQMLDFGVGAGGYAVAGTPMPGGTRTDFTATLLADGRVLIAGGADAQGNATATVLLYDPKTQAFSSTGNLLVPLVRQTATLLPDGKVLIAGGMVQNGGVITPASYASSCELYDPGTGAFSTTGALALPRANAIARLLPGGDVLVVGGYTIGATGTASSEIYDPASGLFSAGPNLTAAGMGQSRGNLLPTGDVLISTSFGDTDTDADLYNPQLNAFTATGSQDQTQDIAPTAPLPDGDVIVAGGVTDYGQPQTYANAERYQTALGAWEDTNPLNQARFDESATLLPNGSVFFAGGSSLDVTQGYLSTNELFDPSLNQFQYTASLPGTLLYHSATLLPDGTVLMLGGEGTLAGSAVLYHPAPPTAPLTPMLTSAALKSLTSGTWVIVLGNPFFPGATVSFDGSAVPTNYLDTTLLSFELPQGATPGPHTITVANPGGQPSASLGLTVP